MERIKVGTKVWFDDILFSVVKHYKPNRFDDYLVLSMKKEDQIHDDHKTIPFDMYMVDCHDDEFYPDNKKVRKLIKEKKEFEEKAIIIHSELTDIWMHYTARHDAI
jgi:hypothetical protein